ncbi:hypothetical protein FDUTEX481_04662 [Tolypothrix sp. PCC 7601]|nr:hypothetical protein FDUTEX481_04662 [Tolypothrix sp. PCC 7601]
MLGRIFEYNQQKHLSPDINLSAVEIVIESKSYPHQRIPLLNQGSYPTNCDVMSS